ERDKMLAPLPLFCVVARAKGDVMHRASSDPARTRIGHTEQVDHATARSFILRGESKAITRLINQPVTKTFRKQLCGAFVSLQSPGDLVKSANRMFCRHRAAVPLLDVWRRSRLDQFNNQPVWIDKAKQFLSKSRARSFRRQVFLPQALKPVGD